MGKGAPKKKGDYFELSEEEQEGFKKDSFQHKLLSAFKRLYTKEKKSYVLIPRPFLNLCRNTGSETVKKRGGILVERTRQTNDLSTAIFLSHLLYLTGKGDRVDNFIWKSATEWHEEAGLTKHHVLQAARWLKKKGYIEIKIDTAQGRNTNHYRINQKQLIDSITEIVIEDIKRSLKGAVSTKKVIKHVRDIFKDCVTKEGQDSI